MITVTASAKEMLHNVLQQSGVEEQDVTVRMTPSEVDNQIGFVLDRPQEGDQVVEHNGEKVLAVDASLADILDGATLDTVNTPDGPQLSLSREQSP